MEDIGKFISGFLGFIFGAWVLSEVVKALPIQITGLNFGSLILGVFILSAIAWFIKEVMER